MEIKLVSVIMPAYNVENYIAASIGSVLNQTYTNWELIIVDDGSTDGTAGVIQEFVEKDNRIKYLFQTNARQAKARNRGIAIAQGSILAFLDSDDLWLPNKLEVTLAAFDLDKYDLIFTNSYISDEDNIDLQCITYDKFHVKNLEYFGSEALRLFIEFNRIPILTVLVKKESVLNVGLFDVDCVPAEDFDLWVRLLKDGSTFRSIDAPTAIYRIQSSSSSAQDRLSTAAFLKSVSKNFSSTEIKSLGVQPYLKRWLLRYIDFYLSKENISTFKKYMFLFNFRSTLISIVFLFHNIFGFQIFKRITRKFLKSY